MSENMFNMGNILTATEVKSAKTLKYSCLKVYILKHRLRDKKPLILLKYGYINFHTNKGVVGIIKIFKIIIKIRTELTAE